MDNENTPLEAVRQRHGEYEKALWEYLADQRPFPLRELERYESAYGALNSVERTAWDAKVRPRTKKKAPLLDKKGRNERIRASVNDFYAKQKVEASK